MNLKLTFSLDDLKKVVKKHLLLDDYSIIDVLVAAFMANQFPADSMSFLFIGPSSSAKTELLNALEGQPNAYFLSDLTKNTFISGKKNSSLLPHINGKVLIMKDFTTILSKKPDDLKIIISQLREVCDGKLSKAFGTGEQEFWEGRVGFIGACTAVYDRHSSVIGQMGERFLLYRIKNEDDLKTGIQALKGFGHENGMRKELRQAFSKFIGQFKTIDVKIPEPSEDMKLRLVSLATFCGHGRCPVHRDRYTKEITYMPDTEGTARLSKQLYHISLALMVIQQQKTVTDEIYKIIKKIGSDLIPKIRFIILRYLYQERATITDVNWLKTTEVAEGTGIHGKTTLRALQDLGIIGLVRGRLAETEQGSPYEWQLTEEALISIGGAEIFSDLDENL